MIKSNQISRASCGNRGGAEILDREGAHLDHLEIAVRLRRNGAPRAISAIKVGSVGGSAASPCRRVKGENSISLYPNS